MLIYRSISDDSETMEKKTMSGFACLCFVAVASFCSFIALYNYAKPEPKPSRTSYVRVILKGTRTIKQKWFHILHPQETEFIILVQMKNGVIREFEVCEQEYFKLEEGMTGLLVWSENRFISFEEF